MSFSRVKIAAVLVSFVLVAGAQLWSQAASGLVKVKGKVKVKIKGTVTDGTDGTPIAGVNVVVISGTSDGADCDTLQPITRKTISDGSGRYCIAGLTKGESVEIKYSHLAYTPNPRTEPVLLSEAE